jgi:hypothetical protein
MDVSLPPRNKRQRVTDIIHGSIDHRIAIPFDTLQFYPLQFYSLGD